MQSPDAGFSPAAREVALALDSGFPLLGLLPVPCGLSGVLCDFSETQSLHIQNGN